MLRLFTFGRRNLLEISRIQREPRNSPRNFFRRPSFCAALCLLQFNFLHYTKSPAFHHRVGAPLEISPLKRVSRYLRFCSGPDYATLNAERAFSLSRHLLFVVSDVSASFFTTPVSPHRVSRNCTRYERNIDVETASPRRALER